MKKKLVIGAAVVALLALNALAFSSHALVPEPGPGNIKFNPYQTLSYCANVNVLRHSCTPKRTSIKCEIACDGSYVIPVPTDPTPIYDR